MGAPLPLGFYFTLPDNIDLKKDLEKNIINKPFFLFLFFLFRWFIFEDYINSLKGKFIYISYNVYGNSVFFKKYKNFHLHFFYFYTYMVYFFKLFDLLYFNTFIKFKDNKLKINLFLKKNNKFLYKYKFDFFFKNKKINIYLFTEFRLRLPLFLYLGYKKYMQFFRYHKYNEYLNYHPALYCYPLLKALLHKCWRGKKKNINAVYYNQYSNNSYFLIYYATFEPKFNNFKIFNLNWLTILLFLDKCKYLKFFKILDKNMYLFLFKYFKIYFLTILYLFIYNFWLYYFIPRHVDATFAYKWRIYYMLHLHWWLVKYIKDLPVWLYMLFIIYFIKLFLLHYGYIYNFSTLLFLKKKNDFFSCFNTLCLYKITNLTFNCYIDILYYKFYKLLISKKYFHSRRVFNLWEIYFRNYVFEFTDLSLFYNQSDLFLQQFFLKFKFTLDYMYWRIFFISNLVIKNMLKLNLQSVFNKIKIDVITKTSSNIFLENILSLFELNFSKRVDFLNIYFIYLFIKNFFIKFLFLNTHLNKFILQMYSFNHAFILFQWKLFSWKWISYFGILNWNKYYLEHIKWYTWKYDAFLIYFTYLQFNHLI